MSVIRLASADDERLWRYRELKDRALRRGDAFVVEGEHLARRLLASRFRAESLLVCEGREERLAAGAGEAPVFVLPQRELERLVGFKFHRGVMACGLRGEPETLAQGMAGVGRRAALLLCVDVNNEENMGALVRAAAGLGADAVVLGERCCDAFSRRALRVGMGAAFALPVVQSADLLADAAGLKGKWGVELVATTPDAGAVDLRRARRPERLGLIVGSEADGLPPEWLALADQRVRIPMRRGVDSLNVAVAAGVCLHWLMPDKSDTSGLSEASGAGFNRPA